MCQSYGRSPFALITGFQGYHLRQFVLFKCINCANFRKLFASIYLNTYNAFIIIHITDYCVFFLFLAYKVLHVQAISRGEFLKVHKKAHVQRERKKFNTR